MKDESKAGSRWALIAPAVCAAPPRSARSSEKKDNPPGDLDLNGALLGDGRGRPSSQADPGPLSGPGTSEVRDPTFTASDSGFVNGDTAANLTTQPSFSTTATKSSAVGTYPMTASGAGNPNYTINYVAGKLTVNPALATVKSVEVENVKSGNKTREVIGIRFSEAMTATAAQRLGNYSLVTILKSKNQTGKKVSLSSAADSPAAFMVTLSTSQPLARSPPVDLTIAAAGLLDALGRLLAANYSATLSKVGVPVTASVALARVGALSADAVDAVVAAGLQRRR